MDPYNDLLKRARHVAPPEGTVDRLEQRVMAGLERLPIARRRKRILISGATLGCALVLVAVVGLFRPTLRPTKSPDFVESVVILDNHVCIWLEVADKNP
jgi:hypothetical protein